MAFLISFSSLGISMLVPTLKSIDLAMIVGFELSFVAGILFVLFSCEKKVSKPLAAVILAVINALVFLTTLILVY